jgi:hypothetical protein
VALVPPLNDQPIAQGFRYLVLLDRLGNRALLIGLIVDEADELGRRAADMVDGPRMGLLFGRSLGHLIKKSFVCPMSVPSQGAICQALLSILLQRRS